MNQFCLDKDLLAVEPVLFVGGGLPSQELAKGPCTVSGTTLAADDCDFLAAGVQTGMVVTVYDTCPSEGAAYEVTALDSPTLLTLSVLRTDPTQPPLPPAAGGSSFIIRTYRPQIIAASEALAARLRLSQEAADLDAQAFAPSSQLRQAAVCAALADIFIARSSEAVPNDVNFAKAAHYRSRLEPLMVQLRLAADANGDGIAEATRTLGNVTLRRV